MATLSFQAARACVLETVSAAATARPAVECVPLLESLGRVHAADVRADRDYPPLSRSIRDGFAVRSSDLPGRLRVVGETRAGEPGGITLQPGEAVEIMTGAPMPAGADAVVMVEHTTREDGFVVCPQPATPGQFVNPQGAEVRRDEVVLAQGERIDFTGIAILASVGSETVAVYRRPVVAIISTGDEIVELGQSPLPHQIRNSNSFSLAAQVARAGGVPRILAVAPDHHDGTRELIVQALDADLILLSGGVSAGRYDVVETVLTGLGAAFYFDRVLIQPGQPLVFGRLRDRFFFGLPGNPASTMVTFELFARAALELLSGRREVSLPILESRLAHEFRHKPGLTRFLPARLAPDGSTLSQVPWQGSSDLRALARANAFMVVDAEKEYYAPGDPIGVLLKSA